jgi:hypothetical protein
MLNPFVFPCHYEFSINLCIPDFKESKIFTASSHFFLMYCDYSHTHNYYYETLIKFDENTKIPQDWDLPRSTINYLTLINNRLS